MRLHLRILWALLKRTIYTANKKQFHVFGFIDFGESNIGIDELGATRRSRGTLRRALPVIIAGLG